jgi:fatty acid-binding protein DegV
MSLKEIEEEIKRTIPHVKCALCFESLDNLVRGGRLSTTACQGGMFRYKTSVRSKRSESLSY